MHKIHRFGLRLAHFGWAAVLMLAAMNAASAFNPFGRGQVDSYAIINGCPPGADCLYLAWLADPPTLDVTGLSTALSYDPDRWIFRPDMSGLLCDFAAGGDCPPDTAFVGSVLLSTLPPTTVTPGSPLPGSTYVLVDDNVNGVVSLDYQLAAPIATEDLEQNFFMFVFEAVTPYRTENTVVSFFDTPGNYDFNQVSCSLEIAFQAVSCASDTPIYGMNFRVPEPLSGALLAGGIAGLMLLRRRRA